MNKREIDEELQSWSKQYLADLEKRQSTFENAVRSFLISNAKTCLVVKTRDTQLGAVRVAQLLKRMSTDPESPKEIVEKYLSAENQTFISWKPLAILLNVLEHLPIFSNLLVCEIPQSLQTDFMDLPPFNKLVDHFNIAVSKKCIFIMSEEGILNESIKKIDMSVFFKIDEFENKVTSIPYANESEALIKEAFKGHLEEVKQLLSDGVDVNSPLEPEEHVALHSAAAMGHKDVVLTLLRHGVPKTQTERALILASGAGHKDTVLVLLEYGVDVNCRNNLEWTPLRLAVSNGHIDVVKLLLRKQYGAIIDDQTSTRKDLTPLHIAVENKQSDMVRTLLDHGAKMLNVENKGTPLHVAVKSNHKDSVLVLLDHGVRVDVKNLVGQTALHVAALNGLNDMVDLLIDHKADVNALDVEFMTPLHEAARIGHLQIIQTLLKNGVQNFITVDRIYSPLHIAAMNGHDHVLSALLEKVDINTRGYMGKTALHEGVETGHINVVKVLLKHGANINAQSDEGYSPIHFIPNKNHEEILHLLLECDGADVNIKDNYDSTPLHDAARWGSYEAVKILKASGANRHAKNKDGKTPLELALENDRHDIFALLIA